mmetsp:Transcript_66479/g.138832  ORF Transcript_66479/g.138832 Transcript_66479/m.138832 type:complete len:303 (-) Transcript_66479:1152-2060(-)
MRGCLSILDSRFRPSKRNFSSEACWSMMKSWGPPASPLASNAAMMKPKLNWPMIRIFVKQLLSNLKDVSSMTSSFLLGSVANCATSSTEDFSEPKDDREKALGMATWGSFASSPFGPLLPSSRGGIPSAFCVAAVEAVLARRCAAADRMSAILAPAWMEFPQRSGPAGSCCRTSSAGSEEDDDADAAAAAAAAVAVSEGMLTKDSETPSIGLAAAPAAWYATTPEPEPKETENAAVDGGGGLEVTAEAAFSFSFAGDWTSVGVEPIRRESRSKMGFLLFFDDELAVVAAVAGAGVEELLLLL